MYLLTFNQGDREEKIGLFETIEEGYLFVEQIPSYRRESLPQMCLYDEYFETKDLPDYMEISFRGNLYPLSRFSYPSDERVDIIWWDLNKIFIEDQGMLQGRIRVDAYVVNNSEAKEYIEKRESKYEILKKRIEEKGFEVDRHFLGSQDGEAIVYKKKDVKNWSFFCHLDPYFVDQFDVYGELDL